MVIMKKVPILLSKHRFRIFLDVIPVSFHPLSGPMEVLKVQRLVPAGRLPLLCALTTLLALLPSALCTLRSQAGPGGYGWGCRVFKLISVYLYIAKNNDKYFFQAILLGAPKFETHPG